MTVSVIHAGLAATCVEASFFYLQLIVDAVRLTGFSAVRPDVIPFLNSPITELVSIMSLVVLYAFDYSWGMLAFGIAMAAQMGAYLWVETGADATALALIVFLVPGAFTYSVQVYLLLTALQLLQPRAHISFFAWANSISYTLIGSSVLYFRQTNEPLLSMMMLWAAIEITLYSYIKRVYGERVHTSPETSMLRMIFFNLIVGVKLIDAVKWRKTHPIVPTELPESIRTVQYFCGSNLLRAIRLHNGRIVTFPGDARKHVSVQIGEWEEFAFANNLYGFLLAALFSLRLPISLRATLNETEDALENVRLVLFFWESPLWVWRYLTTQMKHTNDECIIQGSDLFVGSRAMLRRITKLLVGTLLYTYNTYHLLERTEQ